MRRTREPRRAILILGMHRSGTSALARVLGLCGGTLPRDTWSPDEHNATGYWEPATVVALHDELLRSSGSSFDDVGVLEPGWFSSVAASSFGERLAEALEGAYGKEPLWVVKDPRMCRLVPLWKDVLARLQVAPLAVIPVRNPLEVAASLAERDGFPVAKSLLLWLRHFLEAEVATRGVRRSFVSYDALLQDWRRVVRKIGRDLAVAWPFPLEGVAPQVESFLDLRRRHHVLSERDPGAHPEVSAWVGTVYDWAVEAARHRPPTTALIDAVRESLFVADTTFLPLLSEFKHDRLRLEERSGETTQLAGEVRRLQATLGQAEEGARRLQAGLEERGLRIAALEAALELARASQRGEHLALSRVSATAEPRDLPDEAAGPLFDSDWYLGRYPDVKTSGMNPLVHFLHYGGTEGRDPNPLFDSGYYLRQDPDLATARANPLIHYLESGAVEGRDPSPLFDTDWYLRRYPDVAKSGVNPLLHYLKSGAAEGRDPNPLFDGSWYLNHYPDIAAARVNPLAHFLQFGAAEGRDPNPLFVTDWYRSQYPDVAASGVNPLVHYLQSGAAEGRDPGPLFDTDWYASENPDVAGLNPLAHYLHVGRLLGRLPRAGASREAYLRHVLSSSTVRDAGYRESVAHEPLSTELKLLAFYLPQFHPIPENDGWWGRGFTEWTNVSRAVPQFAGHYQPRLPGELGFYDLRLVEVQRRQVELARNYGIHGFCFHFYWFGGKRLLERPLDQFVADPTIDFPFCICWANENWSRRWDGSEHEVLIAQEHSVEDDLALISELARLFADRRYVRVAGKPLLVVYRVDILPDAAATAERWRERCQELGVGEIFLVAAQSFGIDDPLPFGFDAAVEFPPHGARELQPITSSIEVLNPSFAGHIFSFDAFADLYKRVCRPPAYPLFRTVCPSWDNSARVLERGRVYHGSTPGSYRDWLLAACRFADAHPVSNEKIVFINAWNEWSEGAHLEPDRRHGHAYLEATWEALSAWSNPPPAPGYPR